MVLKTKMQIISPGTPYTKLDKTTGIGKKSTFNQLKSNMEEHWLREDIAW